MPPDPFRTLAPAVRAKNTFGILFSFPNRTRAARSLEGHIFHQEVTFYLIEVSCPINILLRTKKDKHKQRVFKSSKHKCEYFYPDLETNNGEKVST